MNFMNEMVNYPSKWPFVKCVLQKLEHAHYTARSPEAATCVATVSGCAACAHSLIKKFLRHTNATSRNRFWD